MSKDRCMTFVASSFSCRGRLTFNQVHACTPVRSFFGGVGVVQTRSYSRVRMIGDAPAGQSSEDDSTDSASKKSKMVAGNDTGNESTVDAEKGGSAGEDAIPNADLGRKGTKSKDLSRMESDTSFSGKRVVKGVMGEGVIEEMDELPAVGKGEGEGDDMDFTRLMTFDGLKVQTDENGEEIVEELEPPRMYRNMQKLRATREKFKVHETDTGSPEYQIASLTSRIAYMTEHIREHRKDHASTRGLLKMVARRTRLLKYLKRQDETRFHNIIKGLEIRVSQQLRRL